MDQPHVAAAEIDDRARVDVDMAQATGLAPDPDGEAGPLRRPWRGEVRHRGSLAVLRPDAKKPGHDGPGRRDGRLSDRLCAAAFVPAECVDGNRKSG
jgi:hypothetical protein